MIKGELAISDFMPSEEKCFEHLRRTRWYNGMVCPKCGSKEMKKNGTENGSQRYYCYAMGMMVLSAILRVQYSTDRRYLSIIGTTSFSTIYRTILPINLAKF